MWTPVARELAFDVLVDFEHISNWTSSVRQSRVLKREANKVTVEYSGSVQMGPVAVPFTALREVELSPPVLIESTQIKGTMRRHKSRIRLAAEGAGTRLDYHLEMEPSTFAAAFLNRSRIEQELRDTFDAAAAEMLRRPAAAPTSATGRTRP
jgi:carbon monoxide dehydrogenase subunit G